MHYDRKIFIRPVAFGRNGSLIRILASTALLAAGLEMPAFAHPRDPGQTRVRLA